jgi:hypothetical protein
MPTYPQLSEERMLERLEPPGRHPSRQALYVRRDTIFGDLLRKLGPSIDMIKKKVPNEGRNIISSSIYP